MFNQFVNDACFFLFNKKNLNIQLKGKIRFIHFFNICSQNQQQFTFYS